MVVLRCGLGNGTSPILYEWEHERPGTPDHPSRVTKIARGNSSMFIMSNVHRNNTGSYRCVVSNAVNLERSDQALMDVVCESPLFGSVLFVWEDATGSQTTLNINAQQGARVGGHKGPFKGM